MHALHNSLHYRVLCTTVNTRCRSVEEIFLSYFWFWWKILKNHVTDFSWNSEIWAKIVYTPNKRHIFSRFEILLLHKRHWVSADRRPSFRPSIRSSVKPSVGHVKCQEVPYKYILVCIWPILDNGLVMFNFATFFVMFSAIESYDIIVGHLIGHLVL